MKKISIFLLTALFIVCGVMTHTAYAEHIGAVKSFLSNGESSLGVGVSYDAEEWTGIGSPDSLEFRQKQVFAQYSLGLGKGWSLTARGGVQDLNIENDAVGFDSGPKPFVGGVLGGPLYVGRVLSIGPVIHGEYSTMKYESGSYEVSNMFKGTAAFLSQFELEGASLYLGPSITLASGKFKSNNTKSDIDPDKRYAALAGIRWSLPDNWPTETSKTFFDFEMRFKDDLSGSLALNFTF